MIAENPYRLGRDEGNELADGRTLKQLERSYAYFNERFDDCSRRGSTSGMLLAAGFASSIAIAISDRRAAMIWFPDPASFVW